MPVERFEKKTKEDQEGQGKPMEDQEKPKEDQEGQKKHEELRTRRGRRA